MSKTDSGRTDQEAEQEPSDLAFLRKRLATVTQENRSLSKENLRLSERLEMVWGTDGDGNRVLLPAGTPDGIACRDETIRHLEERSLRLEERNAQLARLCRGLVDIAQEFREILVVVGDGANPATEIPVRVLRERIAALLPGVDL